MRRQPTVLQLSDPGKIDVGPIHATDWAHVPGWKRHSGQTWETWPRSSGTGDTKYALQLRFYNPSVVPLTGEASAICRRCKYVAAIRADSLHQCAEDNMWAHLDRDVRRRSDERFYYGTVIALLDHELSLLGWTWLVASPQRQIMQSPRHERDQGFPDSIPPNVSDDFAPSYTGMVYDVRLFNVRDAAGTILCTFSCTSCVFSVSQLLMRGQETEDGRVKRFSVWVGMRQPTLEPFVQGRNQAIFLVGGHRRALRVLVQPWYGLIGEFGELRSRRMQHPCNGRGFGGICGPLPGPFVTQMVTLGQMKLLYNNSDSEAVRKLDLGGLRISGTSHLLRVEREPSAAVLPLSTGQPNPHHQCKILLGVGHVHRSDTKFNLRHFNTPSLVRIALEEHRRALGLGRHPFRFGAHYTHFFYALEPHPPFTLVAASQEFCIQAEGASGDCESVQFIGGLTHLADDDARAKILLSYGANDCEARTGTLDLGTIFSMLKPLTNTTARSLSQCFG